MPSSNGKQRHEPEDDEVFTPRDLPDLELLLWKFVHAVPITALAIVMHTLDEQELEYVEHVAAAKCPVCGGTGQNGMGLEGVPYPCRTCNGKGE